MPATIPTEFMCPRTHKIMIEPVLASDQRVYEKEALEKWERLYEAEKARNSSNASSHYSSYGSHNRYYQEQPEQRPPYIKKSDLFDLKKDIIDFLEQNPEYVVIQHVYLPEEFIRTINAAIKNQYIDTLDTLDTDNYNKLLLTLYLKSNQNILYKIIGNGFQNERHIAFFKAFIKILGDQTKTIIEHTSDDKSTILHKCVLSFKNLKEQHEVIELILEISSNLINIGNNEGETAIHLASMQSSPTVRLLIDAGADIDARSKLDETPLHYAVKQGNTPAITYLLERGADQSLQDSNCLTPLELAYQLKKPDIAQLIDSKGHQVRMEKLTAKQSNAFTNQIIAADSSLDDHHHKKQRTSSPTLFK